MKIGFIGLGIMGVPIANNLLKAGYEIVVWNRTLSKCDALAAKGATVCSTPSEVIQLSAVTLAILADPTAALDVVFSEDGVLKGLSPGKGYIDMSTVDASTSTKINAAITQAGGRFLEAPVSGSKQPAIDAQLIILAAGDRSLYEENLKVFEAISKKSFYLGEVGGGAHMKLVVNAIMGSMMASFVEGMSLADAVGLSQSDLLEVLDLGAMSNPMFRMKGPSVISGTFPPAFPLTHQQKDLRLALALGEQVCQQLPVTAAANELYKRAKAEGHGDEDFTAVYEAVKHQKRSSAEIGTLQKGMLGTKTRVANQSMESIGADRCVPEGMDVQ